MAKVSCPACGADFTRLNARNFYLAHGSCKPLLPAPKPEGLRQINTAKRKVEEGDQDYAKLDYKGQKENPSQSGPYECDEGDVLLKFKEEKPPLHQTKTSPRSQKNFSDSIWNLRTRYYDNLKRVRKDDTEFRHLDWQEEQQLLLELKKTGRSFPEISFKYGKDLGKQVTVTALEHRFNGMELPNRIKEWQFLWKLTQEEGLSLKQFPDRFKKEFGISLTRGLVVKRLRSVLNARILDLEQVVEVRRSYRERCES
ncbi:MAG: hypothetical protein Q9207_001637 [Kuettlingeria erythrocarpa]